MQGVKSCNRTGSFLAVFHQAYCAMMVGFGTCTIFSFYHFDDLWQKIVQQKSTEASQPSAHSELSMYYVYRKKKKPKTCLSHPMMLNGPPSFKGRTEERLAISPSKFINLTPICLLPQHTAAQYYSYVHTCLMLLPPPPTHSTPASLMAHSGD